MILNLLCTPLDFQEKQSPFNECETQSKDMKMIKIYQMNFTLCVLLVYNDNGSVQTLNITL